LLALRLCLGNPAALVWEGVNHYLAREQRALAGPEEDAMTDQKTLPTRSPSFADQPHAYDPVTQPQLFAGLIGKRSMAFIIDFIIMSVLVALAFLVVSVLGIVTLGLGWLLFPLVIPVVGLGYNALTIGGPKSATPGQRLMGLEVRMWYGGKVSPLIAAFHALLFWFSLYTVVGWFVNVMWAFFDARKRCGHDILAGLLVVNRP
jgi:uncharacterized RDD family membrane protein YckC